MGLPSSWTRGSACAAAGDPCKGTCDITQVETPACSTPYATPCLQALGLPGHAVRSFVLENDPVPRALLTVDPTFNMIVSPCLPGESGAQYEVSPVC
jgi:hypothetical protein